MELSVIDLKSYLIKDLYFNKVKNQLIKDINEVDFEIACKDLTINELDELIAVTGEHLEKLFTFENERFFQLMYRIDIPEKHLFNLINESKDFIKELTMLVLKRELLKILLQQKYLNS